MYYDLYQIRWSLRHIFRICTVCKVKSVCIYETKIATRNYFQHLNSICVSIYKSMFLHEIKVVQCIMLYIKPRWSPRRFFSICTVYKVTSVCIYDTKIITKAYFKHLYSICDIYVYRYVFTQDKSFVQSIIIYIKQRWSPRRIFRICTVYKVKSVCLYEIKIATKTYFQHFLGKKGLYI